jgi:hypothetical protein
MEEHMPNEEDPSYIDPTRTYPVDMGQWTTQTTLRLASLHAWMVTTIEELARIEARLEGTEQKAILDRMRDRYQEHYENSSRAILDSVSGEDSPRGSRARSRQ